MKSKLFFLLILSVSLVLPLITNSINIPPPPNPPNSIQGFITGILNFLTPVFWGLAAIMFLIAAYHYLTSQGDPDKLKISRDSVIWGVVGLILGAVSVSIPLVVLNLFGGGGT